MWTRFCLLSVWPSCLYSQPRGTEQPKFISPNVSMSYCPTLKQGLLTNRKADVRMCVCVCTCVRVSDKPKQSLAEENIWLLFQNQSKLMVPDRGDAAPLSLWNSNQHAGAPACRMWELCERATCNTSRADHVQNRQISSFSSKDKGRMQSFKRVRIWKKNKKNNYLCNEQHMFGLSLEMFALLRKERKQILVYACTLLRRRGLSCNCSKWFNSYETVYVFFFYMRFIFLFVAVLCCFLYSASF